MRVRLYELLSLLSIVGAIATGTVLVVPAHALAASNTAAAAAYVQANYSALRVAISHIASSEAEPLQVLAKVQHECPGAGAQSPENAESTQMSDEVIGAIVLSAIKPDLAAIQAFVHTAGGLSWSSRGLTRAIRAYTNDWKTLLGLSTPNLCSEVKAWSGDGFHSLPASTVAFVAKFMPAWVGAGFLPAQLSRYESSATRALARRCEPLEAEISEAEARAVAHYGAIMNALEVWP
jgi:hypothetical protein